MHYATFLISLINPFTPSSDQYINSPYNNTMSSREVMRIKKIINYGILFGYNAKFSGLDSKEMYGHQLGELRSLYILGQCSKLNFFIGCLLATYSG